MNFVDLKKNLKETLANNYLLSGEDLFLLSKAYNLILNRVNLAMPDMNLQVFSGDDIDLSACVDACNIMPIMDEYRVVYVNCSIKACVSNIKDLEQYLDHVNPTTILIVSVNAESKDFDKLKDKFSFVDCNKISESVVDSFVLSEISKSGKTIDAPALRTLFDYTSGDMSRINNEISKLLGYIGKSSNITKDDVVTIVTKSLDFEIYELTDALAKGKSDKVFEMLEYMKAKKDSYRTLISLIYNHFRRLFYVSVTKDTKGELAKLLGVKEFAVTKYMEQAKLFGAKKLKQILEICATLDYETKQSMTSVDMAIDYLALSILNIK